MTSKPEAVVDAHAHFWRMPAELDLHLPRADQPVSPDEFVRLMDDAGVARMMQVTRSFEADDGNSIAGARRHPDRFRVQGRLRPEHRADPEEAARWLADEWISGVRLFDHPSSGVGLRDYPDELWEVIAGARVPLSVYCPGQLSVVGDIAARFPSLTVVVDHAGCSVFEWTPLEQRLAEWSTLADLSALPNVLVKASALPEATEEQFPYPRAQSLVAELCSTFGAGRVMWGSNYTPARKVGTYAQSVEFARRSAIQLPLPDRAAFLADTADRAFADRRSARPA